MVIFLVLCAAVVVWTVLSIRRDPRWLGNAYLLGLCVVLVVPVVGALVPPLGFLLGATALLLLVLAPLGALVLVALLITNGVTMIRREGRSLGHLLSLLAGLGLAGVIAVGLAAMFQRHYSWVHALAAAVILAAGYLGGCLFFFLAYSWVYARLARRVDAEQVVVLGAGLRGGRTVGPLLAGRVDTGIEHYRALRERGLDTLLVMSGGKGSDEQVSEAQAMAEYAIEQGVPREHVLLEYRSRNTLENLRFSREVIAAHRPAPASAVAVREPATLTRFTPLMPRTLVVTSDFHAMRAAMYARQVGLDAHVVGSRTARYYWPSAMLREFVAVVNERRAKHLVLLALVAVPLPVMMLLSAVG